MLNSNCFHYHKVSLSYYNLKVVFVLLLPFDYPLKYFISNFRDPEMKLILFERSDEKSAKFPSGLACKAKIDAKLTFPHDA